MESAEPGERCAEVKAPAGLSPPGMARAMPCPKPVLPSELSSDGDSVPIGFTPQKEIPANALLPYAHKLDAEAIHHLRLIKTNLGRAIATGDLYPGVLFWCGRLCEYIQLNGYKFSRRDHVTLVRLLMMTLVEETDDLDVTGYIGNALAMLLCRKGMPHPDDLVIEWRPLYKLLKRLYTDSRKGLIRLPPRLMNEIQTVVLYARDYFPVAATAEVCAEFLPELYIHDDTLDTNLYFLCSFLPTRMRPGVSHLESGCVHWFEPLMGLWKTCINALAGWEESLVDLFAGLNRSNVGLIDWTPHLPLIFSRLLRICRLPAKYSG
jgi:hypothetical protein